VVLNGFLHDEDLDGLVDYVKSNKAIIDMVTNNPNYIFYCEYLVKHTIVYPIESQKQLYFYDIFHIDSAQYLPYEALEILGNTYKINYVKPLARLECPSVEDCKKYMNINTYNGSPQQEGIVIKNFEFRNKWGRCAYAKIVNEQFKELNISIFSKRSKCCDYSVEEKEGKFTCQKCGKECEYTTKEQERKEPIENKIALKYCTQARVEKIINKIIDQSYMYQALEERKTSEKDIPQLLGMVFNDVVTEEIWDIIKSFKNPTINFKILNNEITKLTKKYFFEYLQKGETV
jgi:ATP-dependent RNA circularization protein (DNA/RNA ligase family)